MKTILVDDDISMLSNLEKCFNGITDFDIVGKFTNPLEALKFAEKQQIDLAFLDIEMPEINGLELSGKLRQYYPEMIIAFVSDYESYIAEAYLSHGADCFIMKPFEKKDVESAVARARLLSGRLKKKIVIRTFGYFDVLLNDKPIIFSDEQTRELMAILVDRRGGIVTTRVGCQALFPEKEYSDEVISEYKQVCIRLMEDLAVYNIENLIENKVQGMFIRADIIDCDLYLYLDGDMNFIRRFNGDYMIGYSWAEKTCASLVRQSSLIGKYNESLVQNSLCATVHCLGDPALTLIDMNDSFLAITGYTRNEIYEKFNNSLRAMIVREDFERISKEIEEQLVYGDIKEIEYRLITKNGDEIWIMDKGRVIRSELAGKYHEFVCLLFDISGLKAEQDYDEVNAQKDPLTGLLNRRSAQKRIERYISENPEKTCAMVVIDVDNFKIVNDTYGHPFADTILTDLSLILTRSFRISDVISRLGGDELLVFMKNVPSSEYVAEKMEEVINTISTRLSAKTEKGDLSCSFGISMFPNDAGTFNALYQSADIALYYAKKEKKGTAVFYEDVRMKSLNTIIQRELTEIDSSLPIKRMHGMTHSEEDLRKRLEASSNLFDTINELLAEIGTQFAISRVYIFEDCEEGSYTTNTFEWCAPGVEPQIEELQLLPKSDLELYYLALTENDGLYYCYDVSRLPAQLYDILAPQGIKSMLHYELREDGKHVGFVGFDECEKRVYWNGNQIKVLSEFSRCVGEFLKAYRKKHGKSLAELRFRTYHPD